MLFSIIIINYRTPELTSDCLTSLLRSFPTETSEIILIDNASNDGSAEYLEKKFSNQIKLIKNKENIGFARANNQGAAIAKGKYLFFLNSDTIIEENILPAIAASFARDELIGIVAPTLLNFDGAKQAKAYGPWPSLGYLFYNNLLFRKDNDFPKKIDWVSGAALAIRKDIFDLIGGWDKNFFLYLEDVDLCWSTSKKGYKIKLDRTISLKHLQGSSLKKTTDKRAYYFASQDYLFEKHYGYLTKLALKIIRWPYQVLTLSLKK